MVSVAPPDAVQSVVGPMTPHVNVARHVTDLMTDLTTVMMALIQTALAIVAAVNSSVAMVSAIVIWFAILVAMAMIRQLQRQQRQRQHRQRRHRQRSPRQRCQLDRVDAFRVVGAVVMVSILALGPALELVLAMTRVMVKELSRVVYSHQSDVVRTQYVKGRAHSPCVHVRPGSMRSCS